MIAPTLIVTAGHVVQPYQRALTPAAQITLRTPDGDVLHPARVRAHPRWASQFLRDSDMALLVLDHALPDELVTAIADNALANDRAVSIHGFDVDGAEIDNTGTITRFAGDDGYDVFVSSDLTFPDGVSGGAVLDDDTAIGIATFSAAAAAPNSFIGIPFLPATLGWLRANL